MSKKNTTTIKKRLRNFINTDSSFKKNSFHELLKNIKNYFKFTQG